MKLKFKSFVSKTGAILPAIAFVFATLSANSTCGYYIYQEKAPKELDKLKMYK